MFNNYLTQAVEDFTSLMLPLSEKDLERPWIWKDHDEEGVRFAFFVTLQELRQLAVTLSTLRARVTPAQHILGQYHAAYLDLQATLLGVSTEEAEHVPGEGEWSIHRTYAHILSADLNFTIIVRYALEKHRAGAWTPERPSDEEADRLAGIPDEEYLALIKKPLEDMLAYHHDLHRTIIDEFYTVTERELELPSAFWEETRFPIRHRLHRYEAHFVQHTVQIDKALAAIGQAPTESKRLLRKVYAALAEAEGTMIGAEKTDDAAILATASSIRERTKEIWNLFQ
jgi:hypothetical protein